MSNKAIVTGVNGQIGYYLSNYLLELGFTVYGASRTTSWTDRPGNGNPNYHQIKHDEIDEIIKLYPRYFFNCAGFSSVRGSWQNLEQTFQSNVVMVGQQINTITNGSPETCYINCGSTEEFGRGGAQLHEQSYLVPRSPYATSKVAARHLIYSYSQTCGIVAKQNWLGNCESLRRSEGFVTKKIVTAVAQMARNMGNELPLILGQVDNLRDWSHPSDIARGIWISAKNADKHCGLVLGRGDSHTVRHFLEKSMEIAGVRFHRETNGDGGISYYRQGGFKELLCVTQAPISYFPEMPESISLDVSCAKKLGFESKIAFCKIVEEMVTHELKILDSNP